MSGDVAGDALERWRQSMPQRLEVSELRFRATGNPMYVWEAIAFCNMANYPRYPLPEWCLTYITAMSARLMEAAQTAQRGLPLPSLGTLFGLTKSKGANEIMQYANDRMEINDAVLATAPSYFFGKDVVEVLMKQHSITRPAALARIRRGRKLLHPKRGAPT